MKDIVYWLKQIFGILKSQTANHQADWNEDDPTSASYIHNKPAAPAAPALIVEGALDTSGENPVFEPEQDAPSYDEAAAFIAAGKGVVYLTYGGVLEMITLVGADAMSGSETSWLKPSSQEEGA